MNRELLLFLIEATLAGSAAILVVLMLRRPVLAAFGARAGYATWWLVPAAMLAVALPSAVAPVLDLPTMATAAALSITPSLPVAADAVDPRSLVLLLWGLGGVASAWRLGLQQRRFVAGLGELRPGADGLLHSQASAGLPAVIGWRARIVLPADFEGRYEPRHRQLILCHEQVHQQRRDLWVNAFVAGLRCVFWFNPLLHFAAGRFRHDQELACDAAVLQRFPRQRRAYGEALLKTQLADQPLPVGCHWFGSHPLKERITMLTRPLPSKPRWIAGLALVALLTSAGGWTAWAAQPGRSAPVTAAAAGELALTMKVKFDGEGERVETLNVAAGAPHTFDYTQDGQAWRIGLSLTPRDDGTVFINMAIDRDGVSQGKPKLVMDPAKGGAAIGIGEQGPDGSFKGVEIQMDVALPPSA